MRNEPWVWPEVGDAGTSGAGAVPLRSAQLMEQQKKKKKKKKDMSDRARKGALGILGLLWRGWESNVPNYSLSCLIARSNQC